MLTPGHQRGAVRVARERHDASRSERHSVGRREIGIRSREPERGHRDNDHFGASRAHCSEVESKQPELRRLSISHDHVDCRHSIGEL